MVTYNFSLSPMTTCKLIYILHSSIPSFTPRSAPKHQDYYIYTEQSGCRFLNGHPLCAKKDVYQPTPIIPHNISSYSSYLASSIRYRTLHTVSSASFHSSPSNFLPLQVCHHGALWEIPTNRLTHLYSYIHFVVALYIYLMVFFDLFV
jgi:hypothetical protein